MELKNNLLKVKYYICLKSLDSLDDAIELLEGVDEVAHSKEYLAFQDSVIRRFEHSLDVMWKYIKEYIENKFGIIVKSPKETFRESFKQNLLNNEDTECALSMVDDRNETSHRYDMERAKEISMQVSKYYKVLILLLENTKPV